MIAYGYMWSEAGTYSYQASYLTTCPQNKSCWTCDSFVPVSCAPAIIHHDDSRIKPLSRFTHTEESHR